MANIGRVGGAGASHSGDGFNRVRKAPNKLRGREVTVLGSFRLSKDPVAIAPRAGGKAHFSAKKMPSNTDLHHRY